MTVSEALGAINARLAEIEVQLSQQQELYGRLESIRQRVRQEEAARGFLVEEIERLASYQGLVGLWRRFRDGRLFSSGDGERALQEQLSFVEQRLEKQRRELSYAQSGETTSQSSLATERTELLEQRRQLLLSGPDAPHELLREQAEVSAGTQRLRAVVGACRRASKALDGIAKPLRDLLNPPDNMNKYEAFEWPIMQKTNAVVGAELASKVLADLRQELVTVAGDEAELAALDLGEVSSCLESQLFKGGVQDTLAALSAVQETVSEFMQHYYPLLRSAEKRRARIDRAIEEYLADHEHGATSAGLVKYSAQRGTGRCSLSKGRQEHH